MCYLIRGITSKVTDIAVVIGFEAENDPQDSESNLDDDDNAVFTYPPFCCLKDCSK